MSATPALSAAPRRAILMWCDGVSLFAEFPGPEGLPIIVRYPLTSAGLASALSIVRTRVADGFDHDYKPEGKQPGTPAIRDNARAILRRGGRMG